VSFFDRGQQRGARIILDRRGKDPETFLVEAHSAINQLFDKKPEGNTPTFLNLKNMLEESKQTRGESECRDMLFILSDGEPQESQYDNRSNHINKIRNLLKSEDSRDAKLNPVTFLGCSDQHEDYEWMHHMEEVSENVAALADYTEEKGEIVKHQGKQMGDWYSRGVWVLCNVAAAVNRDLAALTKHVPYTKHTLNNLFGKRSPEEYVKYFRGHPLAKTFSSDYQAFLTREGDASSIPSVKVFQQKLKPLLEKNIASGKNDSDDEHEAIGKAEEEVVRSRRRPGMFSPVSAGEPQASLDDKPAGCCSCRIL
jgi:hypothetical protein